MIQFLGKVLLPGLGTITLRGNFPISLLVRSPFAGMIVLSVTLGYPLRTHVATIVRGLGYPLLSVS